MIAELNLRTVELFSFKLGDVEDRELYTQIIIQDNLNNTEQGKWAKENNIPIKYYIDARHIDYYTLQVKVTGSLTDKQATEFYLKYAEN